MNQREIVLCSANRTAIGTFGGSLKATAGARPRQPSSSVPHWRAPGLQGSDVGTVVMGNVVQAGNKMNPARQSAVNGGIPVDVPAMTVNRVCGSGAQAVVSAAQDILLGMADSAVAGGMENMDMAPYLVGGGRWGYRLGDARDVRQRAAGRPERCLLRRAFGLAHGGPGQGAPDHPRGAGPLGGAVAETLCGGPGGGKVQGRDHAGRDSRAERARRSSTRTSTIGPTPRSRSSPSCAPPSARTGRSRPATRPA